jgi:hypothetical protein
MAGAGGEVGPVFGFFHGGSGVVEQAQDVGAVGGDGLDQVGRDQEQLARPQSAQVTQAGGAAVDGVQVVREAVREAGVPRVRDGVVMEKAEEVGEVPIPRSVFCIWLYCATSMSRRRRYARMPNIPKADIAWRLPARFSSNIMSRKLQRSAVMSQGIRWICLGAIYCALVACADYRIVKPTTEAGRLCAAQCDRTRAICDRSAEAEVAVAPSCDADNARATEVCSLHEGEVHDRCMAAQPTSACVTPAPNYRPCTSEWELCVLSCGGRIVDN